MSSIISALPSTNPFNTFPWLADKDWSAAVEVKLSWTPLQVLFKAGIFTVLVDIAVTCPAAFTVKYGTLNVEPYPGVAFAEGP